MGLYYKIVIYPREEQHESWKYRKIIRFFKFEKMWDSDYSKEYSDTLTSGNII
jgi:hypothetical protein